MKTLTLPTLMTLLLAGACGGSAGDEASEYRNAVPTLQQLSVALPTADSSSSADGIGRLEQGVLGEQAGLYKITAGVSGVTNAHLWATFQVLEEIVEHPPTKVGLDAALWGPFSRALSPLEWTFTVKRVAPGSFDYALAGRRKADANAVFDVVMAGNSQVQVTASGVEPGKVAAYPHLVGKFVASASKLNALDPARYSSTGEVAGAYDLKPGERAVILELVDYQADGGELQNTEYGYKVRGDGSGEFAYKIASDLQHDGSAAETFAVVSTWNGDGAGKGLATVSGGDLPSNFKVIIAECWDETFGRTFYKDSIDHNPAEGDKASCIP